MARVGEFIIQAHSTPQGHILKLLVHGSETVCQCDDSDRGDLYKALFDMVHSAMKREGRV